MYVRFAGMVMIRCPGCGQRALDVASSCPSCGRVLIQNPLETHDWGALRACGRCGKHIERDVTLCPYCGHRVRAARIARQVAIGVAGIVVAVAAGVGIWRSGLLEALLEATRGGGRPAASDQGTPAPAPLPALPAEDAGDPSAAPILVAAPDTTVQGGATAVPPAPVRSVAADTTAPASERRPVGTRGVVTRWTTEWTNVRAARSVESAVVRVLPPGRAVEVREMRQGWWELHAGGGVVGYVANSVLTATPPG
jgi:DNA-directed RNA polymerase subunit RPC12/RpoP